MKLSTTLVMAMIAIVVWIFAIYGVYAFIYWK